jgi:fibronectin-binding autotransporter adhesin
MTVAAPRNAFILSLTDSRWAPVAALTLSAWLTSNSAAQTAVAGGTTVTDSVANLNTAGNLEFTTGDSSPGTLDVTTTGTFTNNWTISDAIARFVLNGNTFTISSTSPAGNIAIGSATIRVENGTLVLDANSFLTNFSGSLRASNGGTIQIQQAEWLTSTTGITLDSSAGSASLVWSNASAVTYAGTLTLVGGNDATIATSGAGTGDLTLSGFVSGTGNLVIANQGSSAATVILGLTGGFDGRTVVDGARVAFSTQQSIGSQGLTFNDGSIVTLNTGITLGSAQQFSVNGTTSVLAGTGSSLAVDGQMLGNGTLQLVNIDLTVGSAATGAFTGGLILRDTSSVTTANAAWLGAVGVLAFGGDSSATSLEYSGATDVTSSADIDVGSGTATLRATGAGGLALVGNVSGSGDLTLADGGTGTGAFTLALNGGFTGRTVVDGATVIVDTSTSIGGLGLDINDGSAVTLNTDITLGAGQQFRVNGTSDLSAGTGSALAVDGDMQGTGTLRLSNVDMTVGAGATGAFTGGLVLRNTSTVASGNDAWIAGITSLGFGGDATATSFQYSGAANVTSSATLEVLSGTATVRATGAGSLALNGAVSGTGTLVLDNADLSVGAAALGTFSGGLELRGGSAVTVASGAWIGALGTLGMNADGAATSLDYSGATDASTAAGVTVGAGAASVTLSGAGGLAFTGSVAGTGNLTLANAGAGTGSFTLGFASGSFTGSTIVNDANVAINSQASVGTAGLQLNDAGGTALAATVGTALTFADAQSLTIAGEVDLAGSVAGASIDAQGGLLSAAAATLNLDNLALTVGDGTASTFTGDITLTEGASLILDGADLSGADLSSVVAGDAVTFGGIGSIGAIGSVADPFSGSVELGDLGVSASSVLSVAGDARLAAAAILQSHFLESSGATGTADLLSVAGSFDAGDATANLVFDPGVFTGTWIPGIADTVTYTFVTAAGGLGGSTFGTVNVVTIDPLTGLSTVRPLDQDGETQFLGGAFDVLYGTDSFAVSIRGVGGPAPLPPGGTTDTDVIVPVQVGSRTVNRNANVGIVQNSRINSSVDAMNALLLDPSTSADAQFVATQLLLQTDAPAYASAVTAVSAPANPAALPTSLMLGMFDAGDVSMRRLMQLRPRGGAGASPGAVATQDRRQRPWERGATSTASAPPVAVPRRQAFGPEIYGPTPDEGVRGWARGFGWTGSFTNQNWAQTSYDTVLGSAIAGADVALGGGGIVGAFVGYMPGSVDVTGGLVDESMTVNGVDFGVYGSWSPGNGSWYVAGSAAGTWASIDRTRTLYVPGAVRTADSSSNAWVASLMGETGWNLWLGGDTYLDPYMRAGFAYFNQGSYAESGAGSMNLSVDDQQAYALQPSLGARFMHGIRSGGSVITPYVGGAFTAIVPVGDWDVTATNAFSSLPNTGVYGSPDTQYGGSMEAGVEWALPNGFTLFAAFNGMFLSDVQVYGGSAGIVIPF